MAEQYGRQMGTRAAPQDRLTRVPLWSWVVIIALLGAIVAVGGTVAASHTSTAWAGMWSEVAKAGVQIALVGVAVGALTAVWDAIKARREAEAEQAEKRQEAEAAVLEKVRETEAAKKDKIRTEFAELIDLYNGVKSVRRALRSLGLDAKLHIDRDTYKDKANNYFSADDGAEELKAVGMAIELTREQADGFREQMRKLNELQLGYEAKKRQFRQADLLGEDRAAVADGLASIEHYLNRLVGLWEEHGWKIQEGTSLHEVSPALQPLFRVEKFRASVSSPMRRITATINGHLFGAPAREVPTAATSQPIAVGSRWVIQAESRQRREERKALATHDGRTGR